MFLCGYFELLVCKVLVGKHLVLSSTCEYIWILSSLFTMGRDAYVCFWYFLFTEGLFSFPLISFPNVCLDTCLIWDCVQSRSVWSGNAFGFLWGRLIILQSRHLRFGEERSGHLLDEMLLRVYMALRGSDSHEASKPLQIFFWKSGSDRVSNWNHSLDNNKLIKKHIIQALLIWWYFIV